MESNFASECFFTFLKYFFTKSFFTSLLSQNVLLLSTLLLQKSKKMTPALVNFWSLMAACKEEEEIRLVM